MPPLRRASIGSCCTVRFRCIRFHDSYVPSRRLPWGQPSLAQPLHRSPIRQAKPAQTALSRPKPAYMAVKGATEATEETQADRLAASWFPESIRSLRSSFQAALGVRPRVRAGRRPSRPSLGTCSRSVMRWVDLADVKGSTHQTDAPPRFRARAETGVSP